MPEQAGNPPRRPPPRIEGDDLNDIPDDPPPAYEAQPSANSEQTLAFGPSLPFQPPPGPPAPLHQRYAEPQFPPSPPSTVPPPQFPFWNGASLTPQQTGFSEGTRYGSNGGYAVPNQHPQNGSFSPPQGPPPSHPSTSSFAPPPLPPRSSPPVTYNPTTSPTPGQPLLNAGRLLVYPVGFKCQKCDNTGYKFNDPSHPCRKDWEKHSRPYTSALRLSISPSSPPPNFQRPLRIFQPPQQSQSYVPTAPSPYGPSPPSRANVNYRAPDIRFGAPPPGPNVLVVRPGDPRIGGTLCRECGGRGLVMPFFSFFGDEETCLNCRGSGRVFR